MAGEQLESQAEGDAETLSASAPEGDATAVAVPAAGRIRESEMPVGSAWESPTPDRESSQDLSTRQRRTSHATSVQGTHATASMPLEAMRIDEWERTRHFCRQALVIAGAAFFAGPLLGGDETAKIVMYGGLLAGMSALVWLIVALRTVEAYTVRLIFPAALVLGVAVQTGIYFFGIFSPAPALVLLGIYFFSKGSFANTTAAIYGLCAFSLALLGGLIIAGVIDDRGLISGAHLERHEQLIVVGIVQLLYLVSFLVARGARRSQLMALTKLEEALRQVGVREALLEEAQGDLKRAMRIGDAGRHSGQVVGGFKLGVLIGRGGMGEVYEAVHVETDLVAAVKLLHPAALASADQLGRFIREIKAVAAIEAPEVVSVYEFGNLADGAPYLVMEKLDGVDLSTYLRKRRRMPPKHVIELVRQVGRGLTAAWEQGIVHRDIKPQNLFRVGSGKSVRWKVLDFGVSKLATTSGTLTQGHVVGTPGYMAPEQAKGLEVDKRADLYALAVIAYRALTGRPAYSAKCPRPCTKSSMDRLTDRPTSRPT